MNEVTSSTTTFSENVRPFKPKSILRNSKSTPNLRKKQSKTSINKSKTNNAAPTTSRFGSFVSKFTSSCEHLLSKIRTISEEVFTTDDLVKDFFIDSDEDSDDLTTLERITKANKGYTTAEEKFVVEYSKTKSLEKMYEQAQMKIQSQASGSISPPAVPPKVGDQLQDVIRSAHSTNNSTNNNNNNSIINNIGNNVTLSASDSSLATFSFHDIDVCEMRKELETNVELTSNDATLTEKSINIGDTLWNYRRGKWLVTSKTKEEIDNRVSSHLIKELPVDSHTKIYSTLVNKGKSLKKDKRLNLQDLVVIIDAGWVAEEKWERAANGLS